MTEPDYIESSYSNGAVVIRFKSGVYFDFMKLQATTDYLIALVNHKNCSHMIIDKIGRASCKERV